MRDLKNNPIVKILVALVVMIGLASVQIMDSTAQATDEGWSIPINLSRSGATRDPELIVDSSGIFHAIWIDDIDGYVYTQSSNGKNWSTPTPVTLPFQVDNSAPILLSDPNGYIHTFWTDGENRLFYSRVLNSEFSNPISWEGAISLAESALDMDATIDNAGNIHLSYIRPINSEQFPAGIYYRQSIDSGQSWSNAISIYDSNYYRSLTSTDVHIQISSTNLDGENYIYLAWDNRPINRIYLARSFDAGNSWENPIAIAEPSADNVNTTPFNIIVQPDKNNMLVIWQTGQPGSTTCTQYFQWSDDRGETWSDRQSMFDEINGCATENKFLYPINGLNLLWTSIQDQIYLQAWDGSEWSDPQYQPELDNFINPETLNLVDFGCRKAAQNLENRVNVIGCDESSNGDIWIVSRSLGDISEWYPPPSAWSQPEIITTSGVDFLSPVVSSDNNNRLHIFWSQADDPQFPEIGTAIYYMRYSNEQWSLPINIFFTQHGKADQISVATDTTDRIQLVWSGETYGQIMYSWANATRSTTTSEWATPVSLPSVQPLNSSPSIYIDNMGTMYVIYAQPINEERGIYLVKSEDRGASWSDPLIVFDAASAGWEIIDQPKIARSADGKLHTLFKRLPLQGTRELESLHYSQSNDDGLTWSDPEMIVEGSIPYSQIYSIGSSTVHRIWQEVLEFGDIVQHDFSSDDGTTWQRSTTISNLGETPSHITSVVSPSNQFFLLQIHEASSGDQTLREFEWNDSDWSQGESLQLKIQNGDLTNNILSSIASEGKIIGIVSQKESVLNTGTTTNILWSTGHQIQTRVEIEITEQPAVNVPIPQTQTPSNATPTFIPEESATPTQSVNIISQETNNGQTGFFNNQWIGVIVGGVLVFVILLFILIFVRKSLTG